MSAQAVAEVRPASAATRLNLGSTAALLFSARALQYIAFGLTGVMLARGLGPDGRGVYGLVNETAAVVSSFPGLGLEFAGIYMIGQRRFSAQTVYSNALFWSMALWAGCLGLAAFFLITGEDALGMSSRQIAIALVGACLITITDGSSEFLMPFGRVWPYTMLKVLVPVTRLIGVALIVLASDLTTRSASTIWLASIAVGAAITLYFLSQHITIRPGLNWRAFKAQASFGARVQAGWILQALNHRLDVFLIGYFVGTAGVGEYLVGVNLAELTWWIPMALGTVLFAKVAAMDMADNFETSAAACRRTLMVTFVASLGLIVMARPLIPLVYGSEFRESATVFMILLPSGMLYTIHKCLGASLAANGMPQATLFAGVVSLPVTIALCLTLVRAWGIQGAAIASDIAYLVNAAAVLFIFLRVSKMSVRNALVFNASDWEAFRVKARDIYNNRIRRNAAPVPAVTGVGDDND